MLGVACLLAAVLVALGVWLGAAGPLGAGLETLTRGLVGVYAVVVPVVLVVVGVLLIRGRQPQGPTAPQRSRRRSAASADAEPTDADGTAVMDLPVDRTPARRRRRFRRPRISRRGSPVAGGWRSGPSIFRTRGGSTSSGASGRPISATGSGSWPGA